MHSGEGENEKIVPEPSRSDLIAPLNKPAMPHPGESQGKIVERSERAWWRRAHWYKVGLFVVSLFMFILAITMMKEGARVLGPIVRDRFMVNNPANSLGFGWLFAYLIMSGSPVAAAALTFFDAGVISRLDAYTMITGSRLGASLIVLFIGFIYILRGRDRSSSLGMGLLSLVVTGTTHLLALPVGLLLLDLGLMEQSQPTSGGVISSFTDKVFDPIIAVSVTYLPDWALFLVGFGIMMASFTLFDRALPEMTLRESQVGRMSRFIYRPWVMFLLGAAITMLSMSVSISLSILVPLSARGFVRRENVIPYIMGANVTTFIDTVLAAVLLDNPGASTIIFVNMASITIVSAFVLATFYRRYERACLAFVQWATAGKRNLASFMVLILIVPIILMLV